ncbi:Protein OCA4 [Spathaspora sp. JA1]|nr:Protein OCA4 [Spathaspora sp. JA1]
MLVSPNNFGVVEPGLHRCSKLENDNLPFLSTLNLKSIIILDTEKASRSINNFIEENKIEIFNLGGLKVSDRTRGKTDDEEDEEEDEEEDGAEPKSRRGKSEKVSSNTLEVISLGSKRNKSEQWMVIEKNVIIQAFELILNKHKYPMLVVDSTSTLIGILRKIQKWNFNSILNEYRIYVGSSNKNNYSAETFLELIQLELLSYEVSQLKQQQQQQPEQPHQHRHSKSRDELLFSPQPRHSVDLETDMSPTNLMKSPYLLPTRRDSLRPAIPHRMSVDEDMSEGSIDDMDDLDDDLLSASPQIPQNLLKFVEQRKTREEEQQQQPPPSDSDTDTLVITPQNTGLSRSSRNNSFGTDLFRGGNSGSTSSNNMDRRRSVDYKLVRNIKFRTPQQTTQPSRSSYEGPSSFNKKKHLNRNYSPFEIEELKRQIDFKYYKNLNKYPIVYENVGGVIKLKLPGENKLPDWFIKGRNCWERNYKLLNSE